MKQSHLRALQRVYLVLLFSFMYVPIAVTLVLMALSTVILAKLGMFK